MSERTASRKEETHRTEVVLDRRALARCESIARKGGHAGIEAMIARALTIYWKALSECGSLGYAVELWWPYDDWGDGERWIGLARCFQVREHGILPQQAAAPVVRTIALDFSPQDAGRIDWMRSSFEGASFTQLLELALVFYEVLLDHRNGTYRGGWHLRINRIVEVTKRRWLMPWKTYKRRVWSGSAYYRVRRIIAEW